MGSKFTHIYSVGVDLLIEGVLTCPCNVCTTGAQVLVGSWTRLWSKKSLQTQISGICLLIFELFEVHSQITKLLARNVFICGGFCGVLKSFRLARTFLVMFTSVGSVF